MTRLSILTVLAVVVPAIPAAARPGDRPNIIWMVAEDASPHIGCYGEKTIRTPQLDRMAALGVRFTNAFVTCPVCSPSRSAMVSGMYQTTLGAHNHRSCGTKGKSGGNEAYYDSYRVPERIRLIPQLFADAGYFVVNGGNSKTDYNFVSQGDLYHGSDWKGRAEGQPFFAQIQLRGGKNRSEKVDSPVNPDDVTLPVYYPDHPELRADWARYLNSWVATDNEVGEVFARLKSEGILKSTVVFFWTDHGISHLRGKQFLYDEGIRVPLLVRFPNNLMAGTTRDDLVSHIDVAATSLDLAGIPVPDYVQGRVMFGKEHEPRAFAGEFQPRDRIYSARDRCDETVDVIRCVRTRRFKYIRNFLAHAPHMQPNQYKDGKSITKVMRQLHANARLTPLQARVFARVRPPEELYDLKNDPDETKNLALQPEYRPTARQMRLDLYRWMVETRDCGLVPEPVLEELGRQYGSKYDALRHADNAGLISDIIPVIEAAERGDVATLHRTVASPRASLRYRAVVGLGQARDKSSIPQLEALLTDESATVRIAAAEALCRLGEPVKSLAVLQRELGNSNLLAGMYAIRSMESLGQQAAPLLSAVRKARDSRYEFTRRIARRLANTLELVPSQSVP